MDRTGETQDLERLAGDSVAKAIAPSIVLERYPKATIEIAILVLQSDGGEWPACMMAASLALADAGVELHGLVSSISVGRSLGAGFVVDLSGEEEAKASSVTTIAYCRALDKVTLVNHRGASSSSSTLASDLGFALESCAVLEKVMKQTLTQAEAKRFKSVLAAKASNDNAAGAGAGGTAAAAAITAS
jgi:exosome complex component RRP41